jgi:hypothetical protein
MLGSRGGAGSAQHGVELQIGVDEIARSLDTEICLGVFALSSTSGTSGRKRGSYDRTSL